MDTLIEDLEDLAQIVKNNGGTRSDLLTTVASVWKGVEEWGTDKQKRMHQLGRAILQASE